MYKRFVKGQYPTFLASPDEDHELTRDILFIHTTQYINHILEAINSSGTRDHLIKLSEIVIEKREGFNENVKGLMPKDMSLGETAIDTFLIFKPVVLASTFELSSIILSDAHVPSTKYKFQSTKY